MNRYLSRSQPYTRLSLVLGLLTLSACQDLTPPLPAGVQNPDQVRSPEGAWALYRGALRMARDGFANTMVQSGNFTDELFSAELGNPGDVGRTPVRWDSRNLPEQLAQGSAVAAGVYAQLHAVRTNTMQAIAALVRYTPDASPVYRGELYALQGIAEILLAEVYCSGVPLSTVDFEGDYTLKAGSSTQEIFLHALALLDTAQTLGHDSLAIRYLAQVGRGRALLGLGRFADAAQAVVGVPDTFRYTLALPTGIGTQSFLTRYFGGSSVADQEGQNGLPFRSSRDPRIQLQSGGKLKYINDSIWLPKKYDLPQAQLTFTVANGIEARLIEAEADLWANGSRWLSILDALRTDGTFTTSPSNGSGGVDTTWLAGSGGVNGLRPLTDPGMKAARENLLFRERAFWLFLTGHRLGDLRRFVRYYERDAESVFPTGQYDPYGFSTFGSDINVLIPERERLLNPLSTGCFDREA